MNTTAINNNLYSIAYMGNSVCQSILVYAPSEAMAIAYFKAYKPNAEYIGISTGNAREITIKGKPYITIPEGFVAPEPEAEAEAEAETTPEAAAQAIISYLDEHDDALVEACHELDYYNGYLGDDRCYEMEQFDEIMNGTTPMQMACYCFYGYHEAPNGNREQFNPNADYFYLNGYGNPVSTWCIDYSCFNDWNLAYELAENYNHLCISDGTLCSLIEALIEVQ